MLEQLEEIYEKNRLLIQFAEVKNAGLIILSILVIGAMLTLIDCQGRWWGYLSVYRPA